jgi:nitrite reductase/ring-hydroxylating ferredoxin subunit
MDETKWTAVCTVDELPPGTQARVTVEYQAIALFHTFRGELYAVANKCYHMGGPLSEGRVVDDVAGHCAVICPWHSYVIALDTGEAFYHPVGPDPTEWKCKGKRQRVYLAVVHDGKVWVSHDEKKDAASTDQDDADFSW